MFKFDFKNGDTLEMKGIKYLEANSEETYCFNANVYLNGKKVIEVSNDGHGGANREYPTEAFGYGGLRDIEKRCREEMPKWTMDHFVDPENKTEHDTTFEHWCLSQVGDWLDEKHYKRQLSNKLFIVEKNEPNEIYEIKFRSKPKKIEKSHIVSARGLYPEALILNDIPLNEAIAIFKNGGLLNA